MSNSISRQNSKDKKSKSTKKISSRKRKLSSSKPKNSKSLKSSITTFKQLSIDSISDAGSSSMNGDNNCSYCEVNQTFPEEAKLNKFNHFCHFIYDDDHYHADAKEISSSIHESLGMTCLGKGKYGCVDSIHLTSLKHKTKTNFAVKRITIQSSSLNSNAGTSLKYTLKEQDVFYNASKLNSKYTIQYFGSMMYEGQFYMILEKMDANLTQFNKASVELGYTRRLPIPMVFIKRLATGPTYIE